MSQMLGSPAAFPSDKQMGGWLPLPHIVSGYCVYPFHPYPSPPNSPAQNGEPGPSSAKSRQRNRFSWSGLAAPGAAGGGGGGQGRFGEKANAYEVPLDVGDEFFAFEEFRSRGDGDGKGEVWYRGYVIQAVSLVSIAPRPKPQPLPPLTSNAAFPRPEPSVLVGIFPASVVQPRPTSGDDLGEPSEAYQTAVRLAQEKSRAASKGYEMDVVQEEDESELSLKSTLVSPPLEVEEGVVDIPADSKRKSVMAPTGLGGSRSSRPKSLLLLPNPTEGEEKEQPPLPTLTAGDSTVAGQQWPLIDEISCAIREWYGRIPTYLANREYRLFNLVVQHIDALFLGRRQLLSQTLSADELIRVRRECVSRLVKCNVAQGLEVIVRSLEDGSVMVVDKDRVVGAAGYMTGITAYVYQVQLAYIDLIPLGNLFGRLPSISPASSDPRRSLQAVEKPGPTLAGMFYHLLLDFRAFIASPCAPGETAELYFSLYSKTDNQFITEEYCLILNHLGSPARDAEQRLGRLRTLFTDLKGDEVNGNGQVYLVCRLIRNGAINTRLEASSSGTRSISDSRRPSSVRPTGTYLSPHTYHSGTMRSNASAASVVTDDSWSITSGFGGHRTNTVGTSVTATTSVIDGRPSFRRPLGCAVLELPKLSKMLSDGSEKGGMEFSIPIFTPLSEETFATLHEDIIFGRMGGVATSPRVEAIAVGVRVLQGEVEQLVYEHPSILADSPLSVRLGFPDVVPPHQTRNDIYIKLWSASFFPSPSSGGSIRLRKSIVPANLGNVQISVELRKADGSLIPGAMFAGGAGEPAISHFHSMCYTGTDRPTYGEMVKVALPPAVGDAHLFLSFRSRGKDRHSNADPQELERPFAIAHLPLVGSGGAIKDGSHSLILYRLDKSTPGPNVYLETAATTDHQADGSRLVPLRDRLTVRTYLASTVHSQNDALRSLFGWQELIGNPTSLSSTLNTFSFVGEQEISKFIPGVLDALFGILTSSFGANDNRSAIDTLVFSSITKVLSMSTDRRFPNFTSTLDVYIAQHFSRPASASHLLASMKSAMSSPNTKAYRSFLKVWHLFFRFIIRSRELDRARGIGLDATSAHIEADFQRQVKSVLSDINSLMASTDQGLIGTQTLAVQHYADLLPSLAKIFAPVEIAQMIITFADTLTAAKGSMAVYKLLLLLAVVKSVFDSAESRALLIPALVRWVKPHLGRYEEYGGDQEGEKGRDMKRIKWMECNRLAVTVIAWTINCLQEWINSEAMQESEELKMQEQDNLEYLLTLLPSLCDSYAELRSATTTATLSRYRTEGTIWKETPDIFPISHPFSLVAQLPPPSLLEQNQKADESGLADLGTFNCGLAECAVVVLSLIIATPRDNADRYLLEMLDIEGKERASTRLQGILSFCSSVIHFDAFPRQWLSLSLMSFSAIIRLLHPIINLLQRPEFILPLKEAEGFDSGLFMQCLELLCDLCGSDELALEDHTQQKRRAGWIIAGDLRDEGAGLLLSLWAALGWSQDGGDVQGMRHGGYQTRFTGLAERILGLCLSSHDQLCETAVEILYSMIYAEYLLLGRFSNIETEIFAKLDGLFSLKSAGSADPSDSTMRAYFITQLRTLYESKPSPDPTFATQFSTFLDEVELFIDLLLAFRDLPEGVEWKDERSYAVSRLMDFIRRVGRSELYVRFVHQLVGINVGAKDWLGAGLAMKIHAETYGWSVDGDLVDRWGGEGVKLPAQTQFARRESLYYHAIDYFAEAEAYEFALELCQELTTQHMALTYDVNKITELLTHQARLWERMGTSTRPKPEYFRVVYFGECTPVNQGKEFIVRGQPWQRYVDFCESLQVKLPLSTIHRSKIAPYTQSIESGDIIWVTSVQPEADESHPGLKLGVHPNIQSYHRTNGIRRFSSSRPFVKDSGGSTSGHGHGHGSGILTWTEKTTLITADILPGLLCRSEVIDTLYEEISPLTSAITEIRRGNAILQALIVFKPGQKLDVKQLGTALNGAVDSPVNGGVKLYRETFLDPGYIADHPSDKAQLDEFKMVYDEYVRMVHGGLQLHGKVCKDIAFHEALKNHYYKAFPDQTDLPGLSDSPPASSTPDHTGVDATPKSRSSILKAFHTSPRPSVVSSSSRQSIVTSPTPSLAVSHSQQLFPPLRISPSPMPVTPVVAPSAPSSRGMTDSASLRSIPAANGTSGAGMPSLSSRARSFAGSIGRSSSGVSTSSRRDSVRTEGRRESTITENGVNIVVDGESGSARKAEGVLEIGPQEKEKGMLKRLSSIMRRDSNA